MAGDDLLLMGWGGEEGWLVLGGTGEEEVEAGLD